MPIKAREVRAALQGNVDPKVLHVIVALAEEQYAMGLTLVECGNQLNEMTNILANMTEVVNIHKNALDQMRIEEPDFNAPPVTE